MKTEELEERILDVERVLALQGRRLEKLEEGTAPTLVHEASVSDFSNEFEELKTLLKRHDLSVQSLQIYAQITSFRETISKLPKVLPVQHHHHFEDRSRGFLIGGIVCLLVAAISAGLCLSLYWENSGLQENNLKYRMIREAYPKAVHWADSAYTHAPEENKQLETEVVQSGKP